ncbi:MAG: caspase family protein [Pseudomonadales bacterium]
MKFSTGIRWLLVGALLPLGCATAPPASTPAQTLAGDQSVHCLLPAQVRKLGNTVYPGRRKLVFESETRCTLRGGEYTVYDRASAQSSAEFYRALASAGDAEAQYSLGLVYESLYSPPKYSDAAQWYRKAADQGHQNALKNLAFLHEEGLGVPQDPLAAINLLRQSGGITDDLVLTSEMDSALSQASAQIRDLTQTLERQNSQTLALQTQLADANQTLIERRQQLSATQGEHAALRRQAGAPGGTTGQSTDLQLQTEIANKARMIAHQEMVIASLGADMKVQQAQLDASEEKAQLQEQRLLAQLASVRDDSAGSGQAAAAALAAKNAEIASLSSALGDAQRVLAQERSQQQQLVQELERARGGLAVQSGASSKLAELLSTLTAREQTIATQTTQIADLESALGANAGSESEVRALRTRLGNLQKELTDQQLGFTALELELEAHRATATQMGRGNDAELDRLLREVAQRSDIIDTQKQQIAAFEAQAGKTQQAMAALQADSAQQVNELDLLQARLVTVEAELVRAQSKVAQVEGALAASEQTQLALRDERERLRQQIDISAGSKDARMEDLQAQLSTNQQQLQRQAETISDLKAEIKERRLALAVVQENRLQQIATRSVPKPVFPTTPDIDLSGGKKYALVIGNDQYDHLRNLTTAVNGARAVEGILRAQYGFETRLLLNAKRREIVVAFAELRQSLGENDQVLIYYAGHGERSSADDAITYWLPVDAEENEMSYAADGIKSTWITNEMRAMQAKHVMIVADSCYAGAMVRPVRVSVPSRSIDEKRLNWMAKRRSRTVLTSGGNRPVLDESLNGTHSVFTQALVDVLSENPGVIYGEALHAALVQLVRYNAKQLDFVQVPLFSEVADANHRNGQFVMKSSRG